MAEMTLEDDLFFLEIIKLVNDSENEEDTMFEIMLRVVTAYSELPKKDQNPLILEMMKKVYPEAFI